jgi:CRP-like cAMP-binding protein
MSEQRKTVTLWPDGIEGLSVHRVAAGNWLFRSDDAVTHVYLLDSGIMKILSHWNEGREVLIGFRGPGWLLGGPPAIWRRRHAASAVAMIDCTVQALPVAVFNRLRRADLALSVRLHEMFAEDDLANFEWRVAMTALLGCRPRLEFILLKLCEVAGQRRSNGSIRLNLPLLTAHLVDLVAFSRQQVTAALASMKSEGLVVKTKDGWFDLPAGSRLWKAAGRSGQ